MGCGFAVYCARGAGEAVAGICDELGLSAIVAGVVEEGPRRVVLDQLSLEFAGSELDLTPSGPA